MYVWLDANERRLDSSNTEDLVEMQQEMDVAHVSRQQHMPLYEIPFTEVKGSLLPTPLSKLTVIVSVARQKNR